MPVGFQPREKSGFRQAGDAPAERPHEGSFHIERDQLEELVETDGAGIPNVEQHWNVAGLG
jgi:hypothetical protein